MGADLQVVGQEFDIVVQRSEPYRHHQLGRMKQQWKTLYDTTVAMLDDSMLDKKFWGHAFLTAVYVRNRVWSQGSQCIPYEAISGKLLDLSNLWVFGCQVFSHINKSKQRKLSYKSLEGIFVGYASDCLAWLIYNPNHRSIPIIHSVELNEQWKPTSKQAHMNESHNSEVEMKFINKPYLVPLGSVSIVYTLEVDESSVANLENTPLTFQSDNHHIDQITDSDERHDFVLNRFEKMDDVVDIDTGGYYDVMTDVDVHTCSLVKSHEPQAYLSLVALADDVSSG